MRAKGREEVHLIVMIDGDQVGHHGRMSSLAAACGEQGVAPPGEGERVMLCVPTWNTETWIAYLSGENGR